MERGEGGRLAEKLFSLLVSCQSPTVAKLTPQLCWGSWGGRLFLLSYSLLFALDSSSLVFLPLSGVHREWPPQPFIIIAVVAFMADAEVKARVCVRVCVCLHMIACASDFVLVFMLLF